MARIDGASRFRIALHGVRSNVGRHLCELDGVSAGREIRGAYAALCADVAACSGEEDSRSMRLGGRVASDCVSRQSRSLPSVQERGLVRLRVPVRFFQLHVALQIHLRPATRREKLCYSTLGRSGLELVPCKGAFRLDVSDRIQLPGLAFVSESQLQLVGLQLCTRGGSVGLCRSVRPFHTSRRKRLRNGGLAGLSLSSFAELH